MDISNYEIKNKGLHLVKATKENFWPLMDLRVTKEQENFVAANSVSLAQAYDTRADGKFVQPFGIFDGETPVGFAMIGTIPMSTKECRRSTSTVILFGAS